jgi:hypothetical protein
MGIEWGPDGFFACWIGEAGPIVVGEVLFRRKWSPERRLQTRLARVLGAARAQAGSCVREHDSVEGG